MQQINILYFLKCCTHHTSCFNNIYILFASFKNPSNVLHTLDYDTSKTKQPIASGELCPQTPCFRGPLLGLASSLMIVYPPFGLDWLIRQYIFYPTKMFPNFPHTSYYLLDSILQWHLQLLYYLTAARNLDSFLIMLNILDNLWCFTIHDVTV